MDSRAALPPGLPRPHPTLSYWQDPPDEIADFRSTEGVPRVADVVIVGAGISGASIAYNLMAAHPECKVVVFEARQAASGASGRNGGHTKGASYRTFLDNVKYVGADDAVKIARLEYNCMVGVHDFIRDHSIQCDAKRLESIDVFYDRSQWQQAHEAVSLMQDLMQTDDPAAKYTFYDAEETTSKFLVPNTLGSLGYEAGSLSAYKFAIGVIKLALAKGINLQCNTPVTSLNKITDDPSDGLWEVSTPRGVIRAGKVVLATNGYTSNLYPKLQGVIVPYRGIITAQRPGKAMPQTGLPTSFSFIYKRGYEYMISQPKGSKHVGDIVIGGGLTRGANNGLGEYGNTDDTSLDPKIVEYLTGSAATYFGDNWGDDHPEGRVRTTWSGVMGYSGDGHPLVGPIPGEDGLFIDASFQGHGMVLCFLCARAVTQMILGQDDKGLGAWFPRAYRVTEERMKMKFRGRIHVPGETEAMSG